MGTGRFRFPHKTHRFVKETEMPVPLKAKTYSDKVGNDQVVFGSEYSRKSAHLIVIFRIV